MGQKQPFPGGVCDCDNECSPPDSLQGLKALLSLITWKGRWCNEQNHLNFGETLDFSFFA